MPKTFFTYEQQLNKLQQDLFAVVIALRYLISAEDFKAFKSGLTKLINKVLKQCPHLTCEQLLKEMGFPKNWKKIVQIALN